MPKPDAESVEVTIHVKTKKGEDIAKLYLTQYESVKDFKERTVDMVQEVLGRYE